MPVRKNWVDEVLNEIQGGFSLAEMSKTAGKLIVAADKMAQRLVDAVNAPRDFGPKDLMALAAAMRSTSQALECYAGIYTWCEQFSVSSDDASSQLGDLLPVLTRDELHVLHGWMNRLRPVAAD